ncbi:MAG: DUF4292 domain-containing protein [Bacteroidetes bacterium]|nr:DUF4292 domain-containing protein [Bacteroidota bacterium]
MIRFISGIAVLFMLFSCAKKLTEGDGEKVKRRKTSELLENMDSLVTRVPSTFYSKISTKFKDTTSNISFKNSVRLISDSAMNCIITYASIPVVNALVTNDSLNVVNKKDKCVVRADLNFIRENFGVDFSFRNIEELMYGLPLDYDTTLKYFQINEPYRYVISSHRKMKIKRIDKKDKEEETIVFKYFLDKTGKNVEGVEIYSPNDTTTVWVNYLSRQMIDGYSIPDEVEIKIQMPRNNIFLQMSYNRPEVNQPQELYFIIPEGYEDCE